ncbi:unnamed protein product [Rotaria sp. Silwood1]|nr:unnamed protein product [Rotaria sp. Silwood1]CAF1452244.1 unnamed protein product [Rotaria sp. Silwood1]CAF3640831.1 unnamed protein product [Rotaria sp. Silwood1]CAF4952774.1 unnamed protein product [Rotaria sp. Silwood1]
MVSYCSPWNDRSLTQCLIECSNNRSKGFHHFVNKSQWIDGLDIWSSSNIIRNNSIYEHNIDFHRDIGLYLPRCGKNNIQETFFDNDSIYSKKITSDFFPERLKKLFNKEKDLLINDKHSNISSFDEQLSSIEDKQLSKSFQQSKSTKITSSQVHFSLRQIKTQNSSRGKQSKQIHQSIYQKSLKSILKEQLTSLFTRETGNINHKRTLLKIPLAQIRHPNIPSKTGPIIDSKLIIERYDKLQQLLISRTVSQATLNNKLAKNHQSPLSYHETASFALNVTPVDFSSSKNFESSSFETNFDQENPASKNRRLISLRCSINKNEEEERILSKVNIGKEFLSSSSDIVFLNKNSINEQSQTIKKFYHHRRSPPNIIIQRSKNFELLPSLVPGKRLHFSISNHRH